MDLPIDLLTLFVLHRVDEGDPELVLRECVLYLAASTNTTSMVITDTVRELFEWLVVHPSDRDLLLTGFSQTGNRRGVATASAS